MKQFLLVGFTAAALMFVNMAQANFTFHSGASNTCEYIPGSWGGTGQASNWMLGTCTYHGMGVASKLDGSGKFTLSVTAEKDSGSFLCPNHTTKKVTGVCINGVATITTEYGDLTGNFSQHSGNAKGTLSVGRGMSAEVTIQFQRAE